MVGTRQSARVKAQATRANASGPAEGSSKRQKRQESDNESAVDEDGNEEDEEDEEEQKGKRKWKGKAVAKQPPKKRAKTTNKTRRKTVDISGKLSLLPTQPVDILLEIWHYLPLQTLFSLTRVNKAFRKNILSPECLSVWKSFRTARKAPKPLPGLSEQQWARMLFIESCQRCGKTRKHATYPIWECGERLCTNCLKASCITKRKFSTRYSGRDVSILDLILPAYEHPNYLYPVNEIEKIIAAFDACKDDAARKFYIQEREESLRETKQHIKLCQKWKWKYQSRVMDEEQDGMNMRREQIKHKLLELGYTEKDVERSGYSMLSSAIAHNPLTDKGWVLIRASVVTALEMSRVCRAFAPDAADVLLSRREMLSDAYDRYKKTLSPIDCRDLPNVPTVMFMYTLIQSLFTVPDSHFIDTEQVNQAFTATLPEISAFSANVRTRLTQELECGSVTDWRKRLFGSYCPQGHANIANPERLVGFAGPSPPANQNSLDLALTVIYCNQCWSLFPSVRTALHHLHCPLCCFSNHAFERRFLYHGRRDTMTLKATDCSRAVVSMIEATGSDINTTTADQMDERGDVFECLRCERKGNTFVGRWRECIKHYVNTATHLPLDPADPIPAAEEPLFKRIDTGNHEDQRKSWACAHCFVHLEGGNATRADVVAHVSSEHNVAEPSVPTDFFYNGHECDGNPTRMQDLGLDPCNNSDVGSSKVKFDSDSD